MMGMGILVVLGILMMLLHHGTTLEGIFIEMMGNFVGLWCWWILLERWTSLSIGEWTGLVGKWWGSAVRGGCLGFVGNLVDQ